MAFPASANPSSSSISGWWLPALGFLLAGLGVVALGVGIGDSTVRTLPAEPPATHSAAGTAIQARISPAAPSPRVGMRAWTGEWFGAEEIELTSRSTPGRPPDCLGADLATGQRTESMHLATVPVQRPADCGDVRDALMSLASLSHISRGIEVDPGPSAFIGAAPSAADGIDVAAAALYGPPDRQPEVAWLRETANSNRGAVRSYLEQTAMGRWLTPGFRAVLAWEETSGYDAVEASCAAITRQRRPECRMLTHPVHGEAIITDNRPLSETKLAACLDDGLTPGAWLEILN